MTDYNPKRGGSYNYGGKQWKLSRSKIDLFLECPRCFYIDNKLGTKRPPIPTFQINKAVKNGVKNGIMSKMVSSKMVSGLFLTRQLRANFDIKNFVSLRGEKEN